MKTIREWLEELPAGYRERALRNAENETDPDYESLNTKVLSMAAAIDNGFAWETSPEGFDFWNDVYVYYEPDYQLPTLPKEN